jgi:lipoprotein-releasing system ATP-binding protein
MSKTILQCQSLGKSFKQGGATLTVLQNLDFTLGSGESIAIIGSSGSGKTTLLNLLGGLDTPSSGRVLIQGQDIQALSRQQQDRLRNHILGFVYQFHHLLGEFSAQENVAMPLIIAGKPLEQCLQQASDVLEKVGLAHRLSHKPAQLSGGERQRVAIARALVHHPVCVLMDEPTGNLDRNTARQVQRLMLDLKEQLTTSFVIVTHDQELAKLMDKTLVLEDGQLHPAVEAS